MQALSYGRESCGECPKGQIWRWCKFCPSSIRSRLRITYNSCVKEVSCNSGECSNTPPLEGCFRGDEHLPTPFSNSLTKILSLIEIRYLIDLTCSRFSGMTYQIYCPFSDIFGNAVAFYLKCFCQIHLKDKIHCPARSSMKHQSTVMPTRWPTVGRL